VEEYEIADGDVVINLGNGGDGGGTCSGLFPDPQLCVGSLSALKEGQTISSADSGLPPIVVTGVPIEFQQVPLAFFFRQIRPDDSGGGFGGAGNAIAKPLDTAVCDVNSFQNIQDETVKRALLSPSTLDGMKDIVQSSESQNQEFFGRIIRTDSVVTDAFAVRWESESAFATINDRSCGAVMLSLSPLTDFSNSILVHTHPSCSGNLIGPSQGDIDTVGGFGFMGGLIIDLDNNKLIYYDENTGPPVEDGVNDETGDIEDLCGVSGD